MEKLPKWISYPLIIVVLFLWTGCIVVNWRDHSYRIPAIFDILIPAVLSALIGNEAFFRRSREKQNEPEQKDKDNGKDRR
jgi:hypothetical protein